jgi:SIR2-like domain
MATARRAVRERHDWWVPVLFSRLRSGRTYYKPEFTERADSTWRTLGLQLRTGNFTPVLGPGLADSILGSRQDIARRWVKRWQMPLASHNQGDLAQVAQYLRVRSADTTVRAQLIDYLGEEIARRSEAAEPGDAFWDLPLDRRKPGDAITEVGRRLRESDPGDPYRVAAALPVSVYVTTGVTDLLQAALRATDPPRVPVTMTFPWNEIADVEALENLEEPSNERPLVYHLFGRLERPRSLVLTEDDYFEWMAAWQTRRKDIPPVVSESLVDRSLMFVGFRLDDWDFRVVFNAIKSFGGRGLFKESLHVGVQLSPDSQLIEPEAAQEYFESYFGNDKVNIFWGETRHFFDEFRARTGLVT